MINPLKTASNIKLQPMRNISVYKIKVYSR